MFHLNQRVFLRNQRTLEQRHDKILKNSSLNDFRNIDEYNVNLQ